ncbi:hypothetical protein FKH18_19115 [Salmonella enterica]|uniref:Uncharacterized protein n=1 Tax=Salmonella enterica TaxID=28901 RepID=A0A619I1N6_SALER|nr:hypothetical protein [Salmonella enterica]EDC4054108.1 hypothetical protein [Salmonella enterica subsp. enterica serovar Java]EDV9617480.1 hypothetical protein [Salmonella enterica subsp. enterica serovar Paratyphi B]EHE8610556.1 hypothetical protein [Salmonella enterica subsp. enterica serovar 4,[5],12:b:-]EIK6740030.1 hypothetical protein [Salmonella enterica subsp. enterica serovar Aqua]
MRKLRFCRSGADEFTTGSGCGSQRQGTFPKAAVLHVSLRLLCPVHPEHGYLRQLVMPDVIYRTNRIPQQRLHRFKTAVRWSVVTGMAEGVLVQQQ